MKGPNIYKIYQSKNTINNIIIFIPIKGPNIYKMYQYKNTINNIRIYIINSGKTTSGEGLNPIIMYNNK